MKTQNVECLILPGLHGREAYEGYLSNEYVEGMVIFPAEAKPVLLTFTNTRLFRQMYSAAALGVTPWVDDTRLGTTGAAVVSVLKEKGFEKGRIGVVGLTVEAPGEPEGFFPYTTWAHVLKELPGATFVEMSHDFCKMMLYKSPEELTMVRHSASIGQAACGKMLDVSAPGVDERTIYAAMMEVMFRSGSFPPSPFLIVHSGPGNLGWGPPHWVWQGAPARTLREGDLVQAEVFTRYGGFECQQQMSIHLKPVDPVNAELAKVAREAYDEGLAALKVGTTFMNVVDAMKQPILKAGCWTLTPLIHSQSPQELVGGAGVNRQESPAGAGLEDKLMGGPPPKPQDAEIRPGMVFVFEPNACKGTHRVNLGGTVIVNEKGALEELSPLCLQMNIKG
jgi:Xaa-Pro aminopeptidase